MQLSGNYNGIDLLKFLMAACIVGIHVDSIVQNQTVNSILEFIWLGGVPFYFSASGFLLENKLLKTKSKYSRQLVLQKSIRKNLRLYILWTLCYLPIPLLEYNSDSLPWYRNLFDYLHGVLFIGETVYTWPLWFMLALVVAQTLVYTFHKLGFRLIWLWIIGCLFLIVGCILENIINYPNAILHYFILGWEYLFGTMVRNGLCEGFALVTTGMMIRKYADKIRLAPLMAFALLAIAYFFSDVKSEFLIFSGAGWLLLSLSFELRNSDIYKKFRVDGVLVYFIHMFFVYTAYKLWNVQLQNSSIYISWLIIFTITFCLAISLRTLMGKKHFGWIKFLVS